MNIPNVKLNTGADMPVFGFGTWNLKEGSEAKNAVTQALKAGYRLIDTASIYGNEKSVGEGIRNSGIAREEIFVTTKLWNSDQGYETTFQAFDDSLERLGLAYVDLYLIHWPTPGRQKSLESWKAMAEIYKEGRAKNIGVSNFNSNQLENFIKNSDVVPAVNQVEFHPFIYEKQKDILAYCNEHNILVEAYSPLARARDINNEIITQIGKKAGKSNAQVMLRWAYQHGTLPVPKSSHQARIKENLDIFDFELSRKDMESINALSNGKSAI